MFSPPTVAVEEERQTHYRRRRLFPFLLRTASLSRWSLSLSSSLREPPPLFSLERSHSPSTVAVSYRLSEWQLSLCSNGSTRFCSPEQSYSPLTFSASHSPFTTVSSLLSFTILT
ncbi:unnamed protein product [Microthlaspi erraticum]|uniref:Uncharacterized protein n=1 Tax=Microthlaspi erraticum TaxID=1685480 RepID=A0A6D2LH50_9BRAS|nr:unnamed protein product [Microthlaspi erraticum]CAA7059242.1 unnamed protein product [Microthlaspi erraticum]